MKLSILICTMPVRYPLLARLLRELHTQVQENAASEFVEILTDDSMVLSTGIKRNNLLARAKGEYSCFIDDDDTVYTYYLQEILHALKDSPDAVAMNGIMTWDGRKEQKWFISKDIGYVSIKRFDGSEVYARYHNHLTPKKTEIARLIGFPDLKIGEDYQFATDLHLSGLIKTESIIGTDLNTWLHDSWNMTCEKPMYHYRFATKKPQLTQFKQK